MNDIIELVTGQFFPLLTINTIFLGILLRGIFYRYSPDRNSVFGFFMFGTGVFLLTHLLQGVEISMGLTFVSAAFVNAILCVMVAFGETSLFAPRVFEKTIRYENIHNIRPENYHLLVADIKERTGLNVKAIQVNNIDFLSDVANLKVSYSETPQTTNIASNNQTEAVYKGEKSA